MFVISRSPYLTVLLCPELSGMGVALVGDGDVEVPGVLVGVCRNRDLPVKVVVDDCGVLPLGGDAGEDVNGDAGAGAVESGEVMSEDG